jgi:hypothetical protein
METDWLAESRYHRQKFDILHACIIAHTKGGTIEKVWDMLEEFWKALDAWEASQ